MNKIRYYKACISINALLLLLPLLQGCQRTVVSRIPQLPVYFEIDLKSAIAKPLLTPSGYLIITQPDKFYSSIGFGGLLVIRNAIDNFSGSEYYAYDLACPHESSRKIRIGVNDKLNAECPVCHSQFSILYGGGNPVEGPAKTPLLVYHVIKDNSKLIIRN